MDLNHDWSVRVDWDVDDIMWKQNLEVAHACGIPFEMLIDFHVNENPLLTSTQKAALNARYANPDHFRHIQWCEGLAKIPDLAQYGARQRLVSNTFSAEGRDLKINSLREQIPQMDEMEQRFDIVNDKTTVRKRFNDDSVILVDDSPYNIAKFPGRYIVTPMTPWIMTEKAQGLIRGKEIHYFTYGYTEEAIEVVRLLLIRLKREGFRPPASHQQLG